MSNRDIRKRIRKLGGKPTAGIVERAAFSINTSATEKKLRAEQARERGVLGVPLDPASIHDPRRWFEGKPLNMKNPEIERMKAERRRANGDRFPG